MYLFNENTTIDLHSTTLLCLTITAILCGIFVIISKNPIVSVLFLIGLFISIALYLMELGIKFIGLSYLLVYVGAISILFLFILMLINIRVSEISSSTSNSIPLAFFIGTVFLSTVYLALPLVFFSNTSSNNNEQYLFDCDLTQIEFETLNKCSGYPFEYPIEQFPSTISDTKFNKVSPYSSGYNIESITSPKWDTMLGEASDIDTLGNILYTCFPLWLLLTCLILLLAMVGALLITIKK